MRHLYEVFVLRRGGLPTGPALVYAESADVAKIKGVIERGVPAADVELYDVIVRCVGEIHPRGFDA